MSNSTISRRNLIGVIGSTAILTGCSKGSTDSCHRRPESLGYEPPYGINPANGELTAPDGSTTKPLESATYEPANIALIRISSPRPWILDINHATLAAPDLKTSPTDRLDLAKEAFRLLGPAQSRRRLNQLRNGTVLAHRIVERKNTQGNPNGKFDEDDFAYFGFKSQHDIYVWFDGDNLDVNAAHLISFSHLLSDGTTSGSLNDSFLSSDLSGGNHVDRGKLFLIKNYYYILDQKHFRDRTSADPVSNYSLNFHVKVPNAPQGGNQPVMIPIVVDPDTGNGRGGGN